MSRFTNFSRVKSEQVGNLTGKTFDKFNVCLSSIESVDHIANLLGSDYEEREIRLLSALVAVS